MILTSIKESYKEAKDKNWSTIYIYIDIHKTLIEPDYTNKLDTVIYPYAKEAVQLMSKMPFIELGLYTCSHPDEVEKYQKLFRSHNMIFQHVNKNENVKNTTYGNFTDKPYFNVLIDDKSSFRPREWQGIYEHFKRLQYKIDDYKEVNVNSGELLAKDIFKINRQKNHKPLYNNLRISTIEYKSLMKHLSTGSNIDTILLNNFNKLSDVDNLIIYDYKPFVTRKNNLLS